MADLYEYKCLACGGALAFDVGLQKLKCPYCDSVFDAEQMNKAGEEGKASDAQSSVWTQEEQSGLLVYSCKSCGGEIIADANTGATSCPYCNNPVVMTGQFSGTLRPDSIVPFKLDKKSAIAALKRHYNKRPFLPSLFKAQNKLDEIKGIYVPFWLFSAKVQADIEFTAKTIRRWSDSDYNYTETKNYRVIREGAIQYNDIPVDASLKMPDDLMNSLEPYNMNEAASFNTAYMAGYLADKFDVEKESSVQRANKRMATSTENTFGESVTGFDSKAINKSDIRFSDVSAKYTLLPVWLLVTSWNNNQYTFAMNGQTGKFIGELPVDKKKPFLTVVFITLALFGTIVGLYLAATGGVR